MLIAVLLAGCAAAPVELIGPADVVVAVPEGPEAEALRGAAQAFETAAGLKVWVESLPVEQYAGRVNSYLLAGRADYDLVYLPAEQLPRWAVYHAIQPLEVAEAGRAALAPWLDAVTVNGEVMGAPVQPGAEVLWFRADWLRAAGLEPPATWEAFDEAVRRLASLPERSGAAVAAGPGEAGADFTPYLAGVCAPAAPFDCPAETQKAALRRYLRLAGGGPWDRAGRADAARALRSGQAAMAILPLTMAAALLDCSAEAPVCEQGRSRLGWSTAPGLAKTGVGSLAAWAVPLRAAHPQAGRQLAAWLMSREGALAWAAAGGLPAHRDAAEEAAAERPYLALLAGLEVYHLGLPPTTGADALWGAYHAAVHGAVGGDDPAAAWDAFRRQVGAAQQRE